MQNPFSFSGVVDDPAFCDRETEQAEFKNFIHNSQNILLFSHRRYGKTSLILKVFKHLRTVTPVYIDLYGTTSVEGFISSFIKAVSAIEPQIDRLAKMVRQTIRSMTVTFGFDPVTSLPESHVAFAGQQTLPAVAEVFELAKALAAKKKIVIAFDEFQEVAQYGGDSFEKHLRQCIQQHPNISYIFAGSQRHIILEMFNDAKRAFYRQAASYPLEKISAESYVKWINGLYRAHDRKLDTTVILEIVNRCDRHPMYVQEFFFHLWPESTPDIEMVDVIERGIVQTRTAGYVFAWDSFSLNQRKGLKMVAALNGKNLFTAENLSRFDFRTASQLKGALDFLERREFIVKNGAYQIEDPIFKRWIRAVS